MPWWSKPPKSQAPRFCTPRICPTGQRICDTFPKFEETGQSKIFPDAAFGYWKATVERVFLDCQKEKRVCAIRMTFHGRRIQPEALKYCRTELM